MRSAAESLFVRVDATQHTGLGHFMRCLALAEAWHDSNGAVTFVGTYEKQPTERLEDEQISFSPIAAEAGAKADLEKTLAAIPQGSAIVLDGYAFGVEYQQMLATHGTLLVIDDYAHQSAYAGSLLLNQNPNAADIEYHQAPPLRLLGPQYLLLSRSFAGTSVRSVSGEPATRLLVTMGGADLHNVGASICNALCAASTKSQIRLLIGPLNSDCESIIRNLDHPQRVDICIAPTDMATTLAWADLAISAAGTTALQLARLGVPAVLTALAENQYGLGTSLDAAGTAVYLGPWAGTTPAAVATATLTLAGDTTRIDKMSAAGRRLVDGRGAARVCAALSAQSQQRG